MLRDIIIRNRPDGKLTFALLYILRRQQILGALLLLITTVPMWMSVNHVWPLGHNEWLLFLAVGAWIELYTAFRIPAELKKEGNNGSK